MNMQTSQFSNLTIHRALIVALCCILGLDLVLDLNGSFALQGAFAEADALAKHEGFRISDGLFLAFLIPYLAALVGAWRGKSWAARWLVVGAIGMAACLDAALLHPVEMMLDTVWSMLEGALVAALWLAPAGKRQDDPSVSEVGSVK